MYIISQYKKDWKLRTLTHILAKYPLKRNPDSHTPN